MTKLSNSSYCQTLIPNHSSSARRLGKEWDFSNFFFFLASVCLFCLFFLLFALLPLISFKGKQVLKFVVDCNEVLQNAL